MAKMRLENVTFSYGAEPVVRHMSFSMEQGVFYGIVGPNGAGKSTILKLLDGFLTPKEGAVYLDGRPLATYSLAQLSREVALVPQTVYDFPFTVFETVLLGRVPFYTRLGKPSRQDVEIALETMALTETSHLRRRLMGDLSGGERQRVNIARVFAQKTQVLLLDEPTTHLDLEHQVRVLELVKEKAKQGVTAIAVLHDLNLAANYCDHIFMINKGSLVLSGPPEDVFTPDLIEKIYQVPVLRLSHPQTGRPIIVPAGH